MKLRLDPWSAEYGPSLSLSELEEDARSSTDLNVELETAHWRPIGSAESAGPDRLAVIDGVRRVEAHLRWEGEKSSKPALFGSLGAGALVLKLGVQARMEEALQLPLFRRLLSLLGDELPQLAFPGQLEKRAIAGDDPERLVQDLQSQMRAAESSIAGDLSSSGVPLVLCDGPLQGIHKLGDAGVVGYVKSHRRLLIPNELVSTLLRLAPGERTPIFRLDAPPGSENYDRFTWYLRLAEPGLCETALAGVVRLEVQALHGLEHAQRRARETAALLPRLVGGRHRDPRSPQNLVPLGALERELRRRLGDAMLIQRQLRTALSA